MSFIDKYADFIAKQQKDLRSSTVNTIEEGKMTRSDIAALEDPKDKIDAKDFAALRAGKHKKKIKDEEEENLDEVLTKKQPTSEWIRDFIASKNPKFAGKSKGKRREMAIAAYYAKQREE